MIGKFSIHVSKEYLNFSVAHFVLFSDSCEVLHGHNYRVEAEIRGDLDEIGYVVDFSVVKGILKKICDEIDHKMILPAENPNIEIQRNGDDLRVTFRDKSFSFPADDVALLMIKNSSAEYLAEYIACKLRDQLSARGCLPNSIKLSVAESPGQAAIYEMEL